VQFSQEPQEIAQCSGGSILQQLRGVTHQEQVGPSIGFSAVQRSRVVLKRCPGLVKVIGKLESDSKVRQKSLHRARLTSTYGADDGVWKLCRKTNLYVMQVARINGRETQGGPTRLEECVHGDCGHREPPIIEFA
jgi:hypothetical protein